MNTNQKSIDFAFEIWMWIILLNTNKMLFFSHRSSRLLSDHVIASLCATEMHKVSGTSGGGVSPPSELLRTPPTPWNTFCLLFMEPSVSASQWKIKLPGWRPHQSFGGQQHYPRSHILSLQHHHWPIICIHRFRWARASLCKNIANRIC